ncbi:unnamed protein product [Discosporangium mesarthrocarpum]
MSRHRGAKPLRRYGRSEVISLLSPERPPQSNCPTETVHVQDSLHVLETKQAQGGISRMAQRKLASPFRSLPPILHKTYLVPISACSKGSWGLSV